MQLVLQLNIGEDQMNFASIGRRINAGNQIFKKKIEYAIARDGKKPSQSRWTG
jgi:hypothetical protein